MKTLLFLASLMCCSVVNAQVVFNPPPRGCLDVLADIQSVQGELAALNADKTTNEAAYNLAKTNLAQAVADSIRYPLYSQYYDALKIMYAAQVTWYALRLNDIIDAIAAANVRLAAFQAEYTAKGC